MFIQILAWVCTGFGLAGTVTNIYQKRVCFALWGFGNIGFIVVNVYNSIWGQVVFFIVQLAFSIFGFIKWGKK